MKTLHLMRHAKSAWDDATLSDRQRGLNGPGRRDAPRMGAALAERMAPLPIAVSPALRAQLTLQGLCAGWAALGGQRHQTCEALYTFDAADLCAWLGARDDALGALFIIGHNPALTELANALCPGEGIANLPTAGYLELSLDIDRWREMRRDCGTIVSSLFPRQL